MNVVEGGVGIAGWVVLVVSLIVMLCSLEKKRCVRLLTCAFSGFWNICELKAADNDRLWLVLDVT